MDKLIMACFALLFGGTYIYMSGQPTAIENPPASLGKGVSIVYFGAHDCPYCRSFSNGPGRREVENFARAQRISFISKEIPSLRDLRKPDSFREFGPVWTATASKSGSYGVPGFALIRDNGVIYATTGEWQSLLKKAKEEVKG